MFARKFAIWADTTPEQRLRELDAMSADNEVILARMDDQHSRVCTASASSPRTRSRFSRTFARRVDERAQARRIPSWISSTSANGLRTWRQQATPRLALLDDLARRFLGS